jgi:hypothetical protein
MPNRKPLPPEEEWARQVVEHDLGTPVKQHDDNTESSMYDLTIKYRSGNAALEVVAAADPHQTELWNVLYKGGRTIVPGIAGGWMLTLKAPTRVKALFQHLPILLGRLETAGIRELEEDSAGIPQDLARLASDNGIVKARQGGTDFIGSVYFSVEDSIKAFFNVDSDALGDWLGSYLSSPETADVRKKLSSAGTAERHAFVFVPPFTLAPEAAVETLLHEAPALPSQPPSLPLDITHVWVTSTWAFGRGIKWGPETGWSFFSKLQPDNSS